MPWLNRKRSHTELTASFLTMAVGGEEGIKKGSVMKNNQAPDLRRGTGGG